MAKQPTPELDRPPAPAWLERAAARVGGRLPHWVERLDHLSPRAATVAGLGVGGLAGLSYAVLPQGLASVAALGALGAGAVLAVTGVERVEVRRGERVVAPTDSRLGRHVALPDSRLVGQVDAALGMVDIPAGAFQMGSSESDEMALASERPQHLVSISEFRMARVPVTGTVWQQYGGAPEARIEGPKHPVVDVTWFDAVHFCNALSDAAKLRPAYDVRSTDEVAWDPSAPGYRLPTEAEWEYACRANTTTRYWFGIGDNLQNYAWFAENADGSLHPAGERPANPWRLRDMHGNVWEWCWDRFGAYAKEADVDPVGPSSGGARVLRGGSFGIQYPGVLRSAYRRWFEPTNQNQFIGFRCVRGARRQP